MKIKVYFGGEWMDAMFSEAKWDWVSENPILEKALDMKTPAFSVSSPLHDGGVDGFVLDGIKRNGFDFPFQVISTKPVEKYTPIPNVVV
jgi:hypothetical protein